MSALLDVRSLTKSFGPLRAVDDLTFAVDRGEVLGFLGPNGAGKSTSMKMITGFLPPTSGTALVCGHDVTRAPRAVKSVIGYLPEGAPLYGEMTPLALLRFVADVRGLSNDDRRRRVEQAMERLQLAEVRDQPIETLSKGFKRRVGLAQAMLHDPEVLILDEPTDGLDPNQKHEVRKLLAEMASNKAIVISTHILEEVEAVCSRAIVIARGRIVADRTPEALQAMAPGHNAAVLRFARAEADRVQPILAQLPMVAAVEKLPLPDGEQRLRVLSRDRADISAELRALLDREGLAPREFFVERGRLDDVFRSLTADDQAPRQEATREAA